MQLNVPRRFSAPIVIASALLLALCGVLAVSLYGQQTEVSRLLHENIEFRQVAAQLDAGITDLSNLLKDRVEDVETIHDSIRGHLHEIRRLADRPEEKRFAEELIDSFESYLTAWREIPERSSSDHDAAVAGALSILNDEALEQCERLQHYTVGQIEKAADDHSLVLRELAWGIGGVGIIGSLAGVGLGYVGALGWRRTIRNLQVHIRHAAGKLGTDVPEIVVSGESGIEEIDDQLRSLARQVERVVERLQQRETEVLRSEQLAAVGQLAAGVAHEIRNPLTSIKLLVQAGREDSGHLGLTSEDLEVVEREVRRMERSLQTFLDFARPPQVERRETDLATIVEQTLELLRGRAAKQHVRLLFHKPSPAVESEIDPVQMRQVLLNLALNSLDAMPEGGDLTIELTRSGTGWMELSVRDTGPGIAPELMPRLFQPFQSDKETGLGLGLVISRRIVEDHGGTLSAENIRSQGACFTIRLPLNEGRSLDAVRVAG